MLNNITSNNLSPFNIDFILYILYQIVILQTSFIFLSTRFLCSLLKIVLQFQSLHNSHTGHCYVMSFAAGKRLDVIITIMKTGQCYTKGGVPKVFLPQPQNNGAATARVKPRK